MTTLQLVIPVVGAAIGEALTLDSPHTIALTNDLTVLVSSAKSGRDTTAAIEDLTATMAAAAASHSTNPTIVNAAKVLSDFPAAHASAMAGQAVVIASPHIEGVDFLLTLERKGGPAAESLGV